MFLKLSDHIRYANERAVNSAERAAQANSPAARDEWLDMERGWHRLAESYLFVETLERFVLNASKAQPATDELVEHAKNVNGVNSIAEQPADPEEIPHLPL